MKTTYEKLNDERIAKLEKECKKYGGYLEVIPNPHVEINERISALESQVNLLIKSAEISIALHKLHTENTEKYDRNFQKIQKYLNQ